MSGTGPEPLRTRALPESSRDLTQGRIELARSGDDRLDPDGENHPLCTASPVVACAEHRGLAGPF